jgi:hypothetical protein
MEGVRMRKAASAEAETRDRGEKPAPTAGEQTNAETGGVPATTPHPSVFPTPPGRKATDTEFDEHFGELEPDDEP